MNNFTLKNFAHLNLCIVHDYISLRAANFHAQIFCPLLTFFQNQLLKKFLPGIIHTIRVPNIFGSRSGLEVIKLEYSLRLKIKGNNWLLADTCPQVAN